MNMRASVLGLDSALTDSPAGEGWIPGTDNGGYEVYGDVPPPSRSVESDPLRPRSPYSASKAGADMQCLAFIETYGLPVVIARPSNNVGPNQYPEKMAPVHHQRARASLPVCGDGRQGATGCS
jgi:dTDP-D-glucose 4,6-dehydratase